jgi:hypothetical protein
VNSSPCPSGLGAFPGKWPCSACADVRRRSRGSTPLPASSQIMPEASHKRKVSEASRFAFFRTEQTETVRF